MVFPDLKTKTKIVILGAGGTGGWTALFAYQMSSVIERKIDIIVCDGDDVEEKNLKRQNFQIWDVGKNKAQTLAERYSAAYGVSCQYIPAYIETVERLEEILQDESPGTLTILIGAVDNNRSRQLCDQVFQNSKDLIYIDSGNAEYTGQVICGVKTDGKIIFEPASSLYPDLVEAEPKDIFPSEMSCADRNVSSPQSITANLMAAIAITSYLYNILVYGELRTESVEFSAQTISMRPRLEQIKRKEETT